MPHDMLTWVMFSVNLTFIVTNLYGWLLKRFFVPEPYRENIVELYPARRSVAAFYLLQLFEVPYLFMVGQPEALFYVNGTALLVFSSFILVMVRSYFFLQTPKAGKLLLFLLPVWLCWIALMLPLFGIISYSRDYQLIMTCVAMAFFLGYMALLDRFRRQLVQRVRALDEDEYSNEEDFPAKFARNIKWLPLVLCLLVAVNFLLNDPVVKMVRDIVFTVLNVWFAIYTLNPHRKLKTLPQELQMEKEAAVEGSSSQGPLSEEQRNTLETKLLELIKSEKLYLQDHLSMSDLVQRMNTNKAYLSKTIAASQYGSFYQLINTLRIEHACQVLREDPSLKMEQVALASGFSSGSAFSQVFKRIKGISPSEYLREK